ncbi:MAG: PD-(D/E)XK nuclease family protein [Methanobacteriaceae archaeon]|nr:PD-(D/E)XK nuclease family protein [Methanobacteriaceae archaeon]
MTLSVRSKPYIIPEYSLTGDLLAFLTCGLQYRYQNKGTLPPSMPIQLWFGDFIHGVMEESYLKWKDEDWKDFPWDWETQVRKVELMIHKRLESRGLKPPANLFCPFEGVSEHQGLCPDEDHPHKLTASIRAEQAINTWGPHLFPLVDDNEVRLKGIRDMPHFKKDVSRSNFYGITGIIDVLSSVKIEEASKKNLIIKYLHRDPVFLEKLDNLKSDQYEVIVDYKGMKRPSIGSPPWDHHHWQVQTYAWLRSLQSESNPVLIGILFYLNELSLFKEDLIILKKEVQEEKTDVMPEGGDRKSILKWNPKKRIPSFSEPFRHLRSIRLIPIDEVSMEKSLLEFDSVVADIEHSIINEVHGQVIQSSWKTNPDRRKCDACDYKSFCKSSASPKKLTVP